MTQLGIRVLEKLKYEARNLLVAIKYRIRPIKISNFENVQLFDRYLEFQYKFNSTIPEYIRAHRIYFQSKNRGFGEHPFHAAWFELLKSENLHSCLEIGVFRGQVTSLWSLISRNENLNLDIWGLSPLSSLGDSVSDYQELDYLEDIKSHFAYFGIGVPNIYKGLSTDSNSMEWIAGRKWDLIYIDGGHEFSDVLSDYQTSFQALNSGGILCFDDSSLYFNVDGRFLGHKGPSEVLTKFALKEMKYLYTVGHLNFLRKI